MSNLHFRSDGRFRIVQFTDLHWRDGDDADLRTRHLMERVLDDERPDLVVLTGDIIEGAKCTDPARSWREAIAPIAQCGIAWAAVFGNHDDEGSLTQQQLMAVQRSCPNCLSQAGPAELSGVGNFVLSVYSARDDGLGAVLYFFDSGGLSPDDSGGYSWIMPDQIAWYVDFSDRLRGEPGRLPPGTIAEPPPALAFLHIPIPEFDVVSVCRGQKREPVCCPQYNSGLFSAFRRDGTVAGVFVGHDHLNDFEGSLHGIRLCYGRVTGYGGYGHDDFPRGARVIELIDGQSTFQTWLRLDDGSVVDALSF